MTSSSVQIGGCWPTPTQELLLRAALTQGEDALAAWQEWQKLTDIENLDSGSHRLLPLLRRNLEAQGVESSLLTRYKSVSRHAWVKNQLLFAQGKRMIQLLENEDIPTLVLKGAALISLYYPDISTRMMDDFDILVPTRVAPRAFQLLLAHGYRLDQRQSPFPPDERTFSFLHAYHFHKPGGEEFDVHRHVFAYNFAPDVDDKFWKAAVPFQIGGVKTRALCDEDAFLHVCVHGGRWNEVPPLRWVADATMILRATPNLDWHRLIEQTHRHQLSIPMRRALKYLQRLDLGLPISAVALHEINRIPTSRAARREWETLSRPLSSHALPRRFWLHARAYARWNRSNPIWQRPFAFSYYLHFFWGIESLSQLFRYGRARLARRLSRSESV